MNYQETLDYLFHALPMFQRVGASAFKKDLHNTIELCNHLGNPEKKFKSIHIAGTNGKGSTSHSMAAILQSAGYKTGLYTSPHLKSFTERIRIDGKEIAEDAVVQFVAENKDFLDKLKPSFFEMTVGMAFWYFVQEKVDIAVIEVGMGGKFDSTNLITPELCIITNIGWDHMQFLGDTLPLIAGEKAGIIKHQVPVIISQTQEETSSVFKEKAAEMKAPIVFANQVWKVERRPEIERLENRRLATFKVEKEGKINELEFGLLGNYQRLNLPGILEGVAQLRKQGWDISDESLKTGLEEVTTLTGLKGRWQILAEKPLTICDTGHNEPGIKEILDQLKTYSFKQLWMVIGMVQDKDISKILALLPKDANYIFCQAEIPRALAADQLAAKAFESGLKGEIIPSVNEAYNYARKNAGQDDLIFVGGSTFVVAEIEDL
ncbi:MAG: bifunctional folylpolyglutamate synthase/dihydrofolate synthase [Algoriphagus sp.]|nr:bifunctional folylpolyglutamate synthase/dihydrofolate synthase [Algoriphagus sp.]